MKIVPYQNHNIHCHESGPFNRSCFRIHKAEIYLQTSSNLKDAKRLIDFCILQKVWK